MSKEIQRNLITYAILLLIAIVGMYYGRHLQPQQDFIRVWDWSTILFLLIAVPFLFLQSKAKLPNFWQQEINNKTRFLYPVLIGMAFGVLDILVFKIIQHPEPYSKLPPFLQPFPYSIFLYFSGALEVEVFYRLIPFTLILLAGNYIRQGKYFHWFFWTGVVLTAIREPIEQVPEGNMAIIIYALLTGFLMNFLQALWYKKAGFLAALSIRLGHYFLWHIMLGVYVENFELLH